MLDSLVFVDATLHRNKVYTDVLPEKM